MSSARHVDVNHPLKGRLAYMPALLSPSETIETANQLFKVDGLSSERQSVMSLPPTVGQKRKRPRAARACEFCRSKKYKCDEQDPCGRCRKRDRPCIYMDADSARERFQVSAHQGHESTLYRSSSTNFDRGHQEREADHASRNDNEEVSELNVHTLNTEFHGPTSSLAFLAAVQHHPQKEVSLTSAPLQSLVSAFHNESFSPQIRRPSSPADQSASSSRYHFRQSRFFLDGYFQNLHFIHPVIEQTYFYSRCEDLWFGRSDTQTPKFVALYYAVMSLGAIIQEWDDEAIDGLGRFDWAKKMFHLASDALELTQGHNDLETVQACLIMAKVCQNELNPNLAYLYLGRAVRTALSAGFNRRSRRPSLTELPERDAQVAKTWWGLYSLEIEMSFALGRPDSLGLDIYHNQILPPVDDTEHAILATMVDLARIVRRVSISIYASAQSLSGRLAQASDIELSMDAWVDSVPATIRPNLLGEVAPTMARDPKWAKKQKHTLKFRYFNVKMVLYRPFLVHAATTGKQSDSALQAAVGKCVASARSTIELMHQMYCDLPYFRTWWYNVTYTLYAASIILCYMSRLAGPSEHDDLQEHINMSIDILNAMKEHVVATKARAVLQQALLQAQDKDRPTAAVPRRTLQTFETPLMQLANISTEVGGLLPTDELFLDPFNNVHLDFMGQLFPFDDDSYLAPWPSRVCDNVDLQ